MRWSGLRSRSPDVRGACPSAEFVSRRGRPCPMHEANDLDALSGAFNLLCHLKIFRLGRTEGLAVVAGRVETANVLFAGCEHIAGIANSFGACLELLG